MPSASIAPPPQLVGLPEDEKYGFIVPAETPWLPEGPILSKIDPYRTAALAFARACAVCGFRLLADRPAYRIFTQRDAVYSRIEPVGDDMGMAGHLSCMLYSALVCPFWKTKNARLGKDSEMAPGARRGSKPSVQGFEDVLVMFRQDGQIMGRHGPDVTILYRHLTDETRFSEPSDLAEKYRDVTPAESELIFATGNRNYWTGSQEDIAKLRESLNHDLRTLTHTKAQFRVTMHDEARVAFRIPLDQRQRG